MIALHTAIAIVMVVVLIIKVKVDPVISLVIACFYLGLASGVGFEETVKAITSGFGEIMAKVGLLIGFGVLIGSLLYATGAFRTMVRALLTAVAAKRLPYAMAVAMSTVFPSIYVDVQVVLAAPVARSTAPHLGGRGLPLMAGALGTGIFTGYVFVIPGLAAISIAGLLGIPLGTWLLFGIIIGPATALVTVTLLRLLLRTGYWKPERDEEPDQAMLEQEAQAAVDTDAQSSAPEERGPSLLLSMAPIVVPLLMIAFGAFAELFEFTNPFIDFLGNANVALFVGLLMAYVMARRIVGGDRTGEAMSEGFHTTGEILLITGVGGSLGAVIEATGLDQMLADLFSADAGAPVVVSILLAWFIAAVLHLAIGSVSVAAITAGGILAPVLGSIHVAPVAMGLAIASGALFALQVNSNFFWMFKALLGLSTQGALKTLTMVTTIASVVSLPMVLAVGLLA
ncbi:H+/gluconate symporter-like permease [Kineosphaera limosa]|uniref:Putative gluconate permease n=1 Tax=Kineosphaera limosa NBRC 100340 TaxID=1184609 RepID=K6XG74_9MICO|nr:SLC13 family permease [Kineosphaera limosa]NYD98991.1 H+/gluconate symporter-like permease [Kineosphaera limosa]GAB97804.1 putative gluconate permease [Kineosphaera limosa NBRC 100340]